MAGRITGLESQRRRGGERVNVYVDGRFALSLDATIAAALRVDQEVDAATLARLTTDDERQRALNAACLFLSYRPRSTHEVETRLRQRGFSPEAIAAARQRLDRWGLLDDDAFARYWVEQRQTFRPRGATALRAELRARGVKAEVVAGVVPHGADESEAAYRAGRARLRGLSGLPAPAFRQKLGGYLQRRGFNYAACAAAIDRLWSEVGAETGADG
ncbi:MAG TPA: RecX family transcriptional regulator [Chloroflexota bacterium]|nr:RecX family transcriptional regulator [Chloroflexota bacterium]